MLTIYIHTQIWRFFSLKTSSISSKFTEASSGPSIAIHISLARFTSLILLWSRVLPPWLAYLALLCSPPRPKFLYETLSCIICIIGTVPLGHRSHYIYSMSMATLATHAHHNTNELPAWHNVTYVARTNMHAFIITSQFVEPSIIIITFYSHSYFRNLLDWPHLQPVRLTTTHKLVINYWLLQ